MQNHHVFCGPWQIQWVSEVVLVLGVPVEYSRCASWSQHLWNWLWSVNRRFQDLFEDCLPVSMPILRRPGIGYAIQYAVGGAELLGHSMVHIRYMMIIVKRSLDLKLPMGTIPLPLLEKLVSRRELSHQTVFVTLSWPSIDLDGGIRMEV